MIIYDQRTPNHSGHRGREVEMPIPVYHFPDHLFHPSMDGSTWKERDDRNWLFPPEHPLFLTEGICALEGCNQAFRRATKGQRFCSYRCQNRDETIRRRDYFRERQARLRLAGGTAQ